MFTKVWMNLFYQNWWFNIFNLKLYSEKCTWRYFKVREDELSSKQGSICIFKMILYIYVIFLSIYLHIFIYTGYFRKVYRSFHARVPRSIYLYKSGWKSGLTSLSFYRIHKKIFILCFNFLTNISICKYILKSIFD